ncbi:BtrH N-terminal domain-containing protein [Kitasatospora sp. NPDC051853]|uniref:BtrH N-terminal domain-containing protein n=1 Tax=Kitasatospora sp. NPDC051853 TaxID=3364058 RepID=UPI00379FB899
MSTVVEVEARGGQHCETTALGVLLRHEGIDLSEPMLFGLGAGLSFVYWDGKAMDFPFLGGRVKPFELTRNLADRLGLDLVVRETASAGKAWENVRAAVEGGRPVGLQLDSHHLEYFTSKAHFAGHVVALYGYRDGRALLVDTEQQGGAVSTSLTSLAEARAARGPMAARHRSFTLTAPPTVQDPYRWIVPAVTACAEAFLHPPIANLGHRGIAKSAGLVRGWRERAEDPERDLPQAALLMERAGTGGALFRNLYRDFLAECTGLVDSDHLRTGHALYAEAAGLWTEVAALVDRAGAPDGRPELDRAALLLGELARIEREAMEALSRLGP